MSGCASQHYDLIVMPPRRVGGAAASEAEGRRFESVLPLQIQNLSTMSGTLQANAQIH